MSEEILIKQCIYESCTDIKEINKLVAYFEQLKESYDCAFQDAEELNQRLTEVIDERNNLLSVLDEIREYIKEKAKEDEECVDIRYINFGEGVDYDLLKILDKVKGE